jgi:ABC-type Fe3+ transport system substrate-binding protein
MRTSDRIGLGRRGLLRGAAAGALALPAIRRALAQGVAPAAGITDALVKDAAAEGALTYYATSDLGLTAKWTAAFTRRFDVPVKTIRGPSYPLFDRWMNEERVGKHIADVVQVSDPTLFPAAQKEGFIATYVPSAAPFIADTMKQEGVWYALNVDFMGIAYNTQETTAEEVKQLTGGGWNALADPIWDGRYATTTPAAGGSTYAYWYMFMSEYKDKYGEPFVRKLAAHKPTIYSSKILAFDRLAAGEFSVSDMAVQSTMTELYTKGAPIRWFFPAPTPANPLAQIISAHAPKPNAARLFQEWALSQEGQLEWLKYTSVMPARSDVVDPRKAAKADWFGEPWYADPAGLYLAYLKEPAFADPKKPIIATWNGIFGYQTESTQ